MKERGPFQRTSGFTLLEVMIALAILAMVGVAFLRPRLTTSPTRNLNVWRILAPI